MDTQTAALTRGGTSPGPDFDFTTHVDTSIARTNYPLDAGVEADFGHTALTCYKKVALISLSESYRRKRLADLEQSSVACDLAIYRSAADAVTEAIENRLALSRLAVFGELACCETYRRASAAFQVRPDSVRQIARATLLFGDVLARDPEPHPTTQLLTEAILTASAPFFQRLEEGPVEGDFAFGSEWADAVMASIDPLLPPPPEKRSLTDDEASAGYSLRSDPIDDFLGVQPPFHQKRPPTIDDSPPTAEQLSAGDETSAGDRFKQEAERVAKNLAAQARAAGADFSAHGTASQLGRSEEAGPHQGSPAQAFLVDAGDSSSAAISEGFYDPSLDSAEVRRLAADARPIERIVRDQALPGRRDDLDYLRFRRTGPMIDGKRIDLAMVEDNVFQVSRPIETAHGAGRATLLLLADISGSMSEAPMRALKAVTTAWLRATASNPSLQVLAGAYNTTEGRNRFTWSWNRNLSPQSRAQAHRAVASMPKKGDGGQADAASIRHAVNSAIAVDPKASITLILLSDCGFCKSGSVGGVGPDAEVANTVQEIREELPDRFRFVVTALGRAPNEPVRRAADETVVIPSDELGDFGKIARHISDSALRQVNRSWHKEDPAA